MKEIQVIRKRVLLTFRTRAGRKVTIPAVKIILKPKKSRPRKSH